MDVRAPHVLIVDSHSSVNRGDAAILTTLMATLKQELGNPEFKVHSNYPRSTTEVHQVAATYPIFRKLNRRKVFGFINKAGLVFGLAFMYRMGVDLGRILPADLKEQFTDYCQADIVVAPGGTNYNDNYARTLAGRLLNLYLAKVLDKPVAISAHSFGPFRRSYYRFLAGFVFNKLDLICGRNYQDELVLRDLGVTNPQVEVTADTAWLLEPADEIRAQEILEEEGVPHQHPLFLGLSAMKWKHYRDIGNAQGHCNYIVSLARMADSLVEEYGVKWVFISTCTPFDGFPTDDRLVAEAIRSQMKFQDDMFILRNHYTAEELKSVCGLLTLLVGTRMHSNIFAAAMGIPIVAVAYEHKTDDLMKVLGLEDFLLDINALDSQQLQTKVVSALMNRKTLHLQLLTKISSLERLARANAKLIAKLYRRIRPE